MSARSTHQIDVQSLLREVAAQFPPEIQERGINRAFNEYLFALTRIARYVPDLSARSVLDLGAGAGVVPLALARAGAKVTVVDTWTEYAADLDNQMGEASEMLARFQVNRVTSVRADITGAPLPVPDSSQDLVTLFDVIEHLPSSAAPLLGEVSRVLKPGGLLMVTTPNICNLRNRMRLLGGRTVHYPIRDWYFSAHFTGHHREFTLDEVREMMTFAGFAVTQAEITESPHYNMPLAGGRWRRGLRATRPQHLLRLAYIAAALLAPGLRYNCSVIARKPQ